MGRPAFLFRLLTCVVVVALAGCGENSTNPAASKPAVRAPSDIAAAFQVKNRGGASVVAIDKASLEKEFLLRANIIDQAVAAMGSGLKSRVVAFKKKSGRLFLLEATQGHTVTTDLPQALVLASFPILDETDEQIEFDFNAGMSSIFVAGDWAASDANGRDYKPSFQAVKVNNSYLEKAEITGENTLAIRQVAQLAVSGMGGLDHSTVEVKYYLSPYRPDPQYVPVHSKDFRLTGFFEVNPQLAYEGHTLVYASKFHEKKPIVFAVSANTPKEYKEAVKQGILYWNNAFREPLIQVVEGPAGVTAPDVSYNVIQWVPHDKAGFAYADAQMDPRTGQILHAQAYLTSAFAFSGKQRARRLLKQVQSRAAGNSRSMLKRISLAGFDVTPMCQYTAGAEFASALTELLATDVSEERVLKASQDYVRLVTAHEVGHLLGLRHNFAGSLHTENYPLSRRIEIFTQYLVDGTLPEDVVPTSSVMDYLPFEEDVIAGHQIGDHGHMYPYDRKAIGVLYYGEEYAADQIPAFCTDTQVSSFVDCQRFDAGSSLIEYAASTTTHKMNTLAYEIIEAYIAEKAPEQGAFPRPVAAVSFDADVIAKALLSPREALVGSFGSSARFLQIYRTFPYVSSLNIDEVKDKEREYVMKEIQKLGGIEKAFAVVSKDFYEKTKAKVALLAESELYAKGVGLGGQEYELTKEDVDAIVATMDRLFKKLPAAVTKKDLSILGGVPSAWKRAGNAFGDQLATMLGKRMEEYVLQKTADVIETEIELELPKKKDEAEGAGALDEEGPRTRKVTAKLPKFYYELDARVAAAGLLEAPSEAEGIDWGLYERTQAKSKFLKLLKDSCGCDFEKVEPEKVKVADPKARRDALRWFLENKKVLEAIK